MNNYLTLMRLRVSIVAGLSAVMGYALCTGLIDIKSLSIFVGTVLLASAACALNQVQESDTDTLMSRTRTRPIPLGKITPFNATGFAIIIGLIGAALLYSISPICVLPALTAILIYNLLYTPLKMVTPYSLLVGSVAGALPPIIGWMAGGGTLLEAKALSLFIFFYLWQVPHFILILRRYKDDYKAAGLPVISERFNNKQFSRITLSWSLSCVCAGMMLFMGTLEASHVLFTVLVAVILFASFMGPVRKSITHI